MKKKISIVIARRNEEEFIEKCLDSIILQDYLKEDLEVLVIDGMSENKTKDIAKGSIIMRMDVYAKYSYTYISKCVEHLGKGLADNIGGITKTVFAPFFI